MSACNTLRSLLLSCAAVTALSAAPAFAAAPAAPADPQAADAAPPQSEQGDIVVTALKRATNLQQTPVSISAVTEQTLTHLGATSVNDYFRQIPNMQVEGNSPTARRITIRGVRAAGEATVGLYYDESPLTGPNGTTQDAASTNPDVNLFDVSQVEVLRGPQGTLYGAGSMGGTLRVLYNKANTSRYEGAVEGQATAMQDGGPGWYMKGMINMPIVTDKLALRVVGYYDKRQGYVDDSYLNKQNINGTKSYGGRAMVTFKPADILTIYGSATLQKSIQDGQSSWYQRLGAQAYTTDAQAIGKNTDYLRLFNLTAKVQLGFGELTLTSSHYNWDLLRSSDYTPTLYANRANATSCKNYIGYTTGTTPSSCSSSQLTTYTTYALSRLPGILYQPMSMDSWNNEARLSGSLFKKFLDYTVGVYYEKRKDRVDSQVVQADASTGQAIVPTTMQDYTAWRYITDHQTQTAFFGEATIHPTSKLSLTAGIRHFDYNKVVGGEVLVSNYITQSYVTPYSEVNASAKGWVSKFNASYQFNRDLMVYASAAKGFRPGGANNVPGLGTALVAFQPDSLWNYEVGVKSQWLDRKVTLNVALFQIDWSNLQVSATSANGAFSFITNAGSARIRGAEVEMVVRP
ncbi:MAG TPA: TonB-dependent receptor, partial [Novosphingobium sp.]|nr:TonB-dependent receptor [Novosphingobium sp.]